VGLLAGLAFRAEQAAAQQDAVDLSGKMLVTAGTDGYARLWNVAMPGDLAAAACAIAGRSLTDAEWTEYAGSAPYQPGCT
jgi:hypothetical protein